MIETLAVSIPIWDKPRRLSTLYRYTRNGPALNFTLNEAPPGISRLRYSEVSDSAPHAPTIARVLNVEANLTTLLYGESAAAGSLSTDEVEPAVIALLDLAHGITGCQLPGLDQIKVRRVDPSATFRLASQDEVANLCTAAHQLFRISNRGRGFVQLSESLTGTTATGVLSNGYSSSVYDKGTQKDLGFPAIRFEQRIRPHLLRGKTWSDFNPTLGTLTRKDVHPLMENLDKLMTGVLELAAASELALTMELVKRGASPSKACRLANWAMLTASMGPGVADTLGMNKRTAQLWNKELRELLDGTSPLEIVTNLATLQANPVLARDL